MEDKYLGNPVKPAVNRQGSRNMQHANMVRKYNERADLDERLQHI